jgi:hypothetical protein
MDITMKKFMSHLAYDGVNGSARSDITASTSGRDGVALG